MFELAPLGYDYNALEPFIDAKTMEIHYSKHHKAYVDNLNKAIGGTEFEKKELNDLLRSFDKLPENIRMMVRNNAGGHANHSLFWLLLKKPAGESSQPSASMRADLEKAFGSYDEFLKQFKAAAMSRFGSGWAWLVINGKTKKLEIMSTPNQDSPITEGHTPILGVDVWEHAYYLKHQNVRANWLEDFFKVINWEKVEENFKKGTRS